MIVLLKKDKHCNAHIGLIIILINDNLMCILYTCISMYIARFVEGDMLFTSQFTDENPRSPRVSTAIVRASGIRMGVDCTNLTLT